MYKAVLAHLMLGSAEAAVCICRLASVTCTGVLVQHVSCWLGTVDAADCSMCQLGFFVRINATADMLICMQIVQCHLHRRPGAACVLLAGHSGCF